MHEILHATIKGWHGVGKVYYGVNIENTWGGTPYLNIFQIDLDNISIMGFIFNCPTLLAFLVKNHVLMLQDLHHLYWQGARVIQP